MVRYHIKINIGNENKTENFHFIHKEWETFSTEETDEAFNKAVIEINHIYKNYGRFATSTGVTKLFEKFGFEKTTED